MHVTTSKVISMDNMPSDVELMRTFPVVTSPSGCWALLDTVNTAFLIIDPDDFGICACNQAALALFDYTMPEMLQLNLHDVGGQHFEIEKDFEVFQFLQVPCRKKHGDFFRAEIIRQKVELEGTAYLLYTVRDISRQTQMEARLRRCEKMSRTLQRLNKIGSWDYEHCCK